MWLAFVAALLVRLVYIAAFRTSPYFAIPIVDAQWHDAWAWGWANGSWSMGGEAFFRAPLYPFWLSLIYRVFGHDLLAARIVQAVLGSATAAALAGCGWRIRGKQGALWAGLVASLYGPLVFFDGELLISNLLLALVSWAFFFLLAPASERSRLLAFFLLGLGAIARPNALALLPVFLWFAWSRPSSHPRHRRRLLAAMATAALLPAAFVTVFNAKAERTFVFIASQGGVNFYAGNNPAATGRTLAVDELEETRGSWSDFIEASCRVAERDLGRRLNSREVSAYWSKKAWDWIRSSPVEALGLTVKKTWFLVASYELPNERDLYFERPFPLNVLMWNAGWFSFPWGIVFPLAAAGAVVGLRRSKNRRGIGFLVGSLVFYALSLVPFFICSRFRMGLVPPVILLAAYGLAAPRSLLRPAPLAALVLALLVANNDVFDVRARDTVQERARHGVILIAAGRLDEGREALRMAIEEGKKRPHPPGYLGEFAYHLGDAYAREGEKEEAAASFRESLALGCTTVRLLLNMANTLSRFGYPADAAAAFKTALTMVPGDGGVWADLGEVLEKSGDADQAINAYRRSIDLLPDNAIVYNNLGLLYQAGAEQDSAIAVWRQGVERSRDSAALHYNLALAYARREDYEAALREITRGLEIAPDDSTARSLRDAIEEELR